MKTNAQIEKELTAELEALLVSKAESRDHSARVFLWAHQRLAEVSAVATQRRAPHMAKAKQMAGRLPDLCKKLETLKEDARATLATHVEAAFKADEPFEIEGVRPVVKGIYVLGEEHPLFGLVKVDQAASAEADKEGRLPECVTIETEFSVAVNPPSKS